jgi:hypothetical protein
MNSDFQIGTEVDINCAPQALYREILTGHVESQNPDGTFNVRGLRGDLYSNVPATAMDAQEVDA